MTATPVGIWVIAMTPGIPRATVCHPNTLRHRLRRISVELSRSLTDPADIADLGAALRALRAFPNADRMQVPR